jgi:hypothetical protein
VFVANTASDWFFSVDNASGEVLLEEPVGHCVGENMGFFSRAGVSDPSDSAVAGL